MTTVLRTAGSGRTRWDATHSILAGRDISCTVTGPLFVLSRIGDARKAVPTARAGHARQKRLIAMNSL